MGKLRGVGFFFFFIFATTDFCFGVDNTSPGCIEQERQALIRFKRSIILDRSHRLSSWQGNNCCQWQGVGCDNATGHVTRLDLGYDYSMEWLERLEGDGLDSSLAELTRLSYMNLSGNDFRKKPIPEFIGSMTHLKVLDLSSAGFYGVVPHRIGNLSSLRVLDLSTYADLVVDDFVWVSRLSSLEHLDLSGVGVGEARNFDKVLLYMIPSLLELRLAGCGLSNSHFNRTHLDSNLTISRIQTLDLSVNLFEGKFPLFLQNLTSLRVLDLSYMELVVDDFVWFPRLSSLEHLDLSGVRVGEARNFDKVLLYMIPSLLELHLSECNLSNSHFNRTHLDSNLTLSAIQTLDLSRNLFECEFPLFLQNLTSLRDLDLSSNEINSSIPIMNNVVKLNLAQNRFRNFKDTGVWSLCQIKWLDLWGNWMEGGLVGPSTNVSECTRFSFETRNSFSGEIPTSLERLTALRGLDLSWNQLTGVNPEFLGNLTSLRELDLSWNQLTGVIPEFLGNLTSLRELDLSDNQLTGSIPTSFGKLTALRYLALSSNLLNGTIPISLGRLSNLEALYLSMNRLSSIPYSLGNLSQLQFLDSIGQLSKLQDLDLSSNLLQGSLPNSIGQLSKLQTLDLSSNLFQGSLPNSIGQLSKLQTLDLSSNLFQGSFPDFIGQLSKLKRLDISYNSLGGVVTEAHFVNASMLYHLAATSNHMLNFKISPDWVPPFQIRNVLLGSCKMAEFPGWIRTQRNLDILILSNSSMSGPLPDWFHQLPVNSLLDLSHNFLSGPLNLPSNQNIYDVITINYTAREPDYDMVSRMLFLQNNLFNGSITDSLCNATDLVILDLSRNMLSGNIPRCLENLQKLDVMILSSNRLSGVIPSSIGNLGSSLRWLQLNNNSFHGELPATLAKCTRLYILDLGENKFSRSIPTWIGEKIKSLLVLRLHKNNFTGRIPTELCQSSSLMSMDLGDNNLKGRIPPCFKELDGMAQDDSSSKFSSGFEQSVIHINYLRKGLITLDYKKTMRYIVNMDLSSNKLGGEIPEELTSLSGLLGLNLSNNNLTGYIPDRIGEMHSLMSLDLSVNDLSGMIPTSMSALTNLNQLNLSHNSLSGQIPTGGQLQTLIDPSIYAGNNELCGSPLPKKCPVSPNGSDAEKDEDDDLEKIWIYATTSGFATGFMGILGILLLNKRCRLAFFNLMEVYFGKKKET